jgi:PAS domain S-box-containing protein
MKENTFAGARGTLIDITDRKHAEASLRESEDNLKSFFHTIPEKVFLMKLDGSILTANEPFATGLGKSAEEIIGDCVYDYLDPSVATRRKAWTNEVVRSGKPLRFEDERQNSILVHNIYPILNPEGAVDRLAVYAKDVTEARQSKLALKKSEERWSRISSLTSDIAYSCRKSDDTGYSIDWMVGATDRILGYSVDEIKALRCWRNLVVEEDLPVFDSHVTGLSPGMSASCELRLLHRDGNVVWLSSLAQCVCESGSSNTPCLYGGLVNISERKSSEEALRASEARYRQLADITFEGIIFHDQGVLLQANDQFFQMFGYEPDELLGTQILEKTLSPESVKTVKTHIAARSTESYLAMGLRKDGSTFPIEIRARMREIEGKKIRATAIRDLTMLKSLETQLIQAQKMEAVGTLAGGFAHDFNNKLQVIAGYVELILCNEELPENLKHDMDAIGQAVHASAELIREMMVFSRKTSVNLAPLNLNKLVTQLRSMLVPVMPKMITVDLVLAEDLWPINAAPNQIDQILMNLSVNARDAMPEGGKLTIQTQNTILDEEYCRYHPNTKPGRYVLLSVTDTGSGMDAGTVKRIFEPFFTTKEEGKGTGLGLSVVYGIVEKHGGNIICDSDPSVGTTFKIFLPTTEEVTEEEHSEKTEPPKGQGETILLVDDEPNLVNIVSRQLVSANYRVIKASNGNEALNLYEEHREQISLVILDLLMPEMDGRRCLDALHDIDPNVRVLVATGHTTPGMLGELEQAGVQGFIRKPFETSQLLEEIRKIIDED